MIVSVKNWKTSLISILIALGVGGLAGLLTSGAMRDYESAVKPALTPPSAVFPVVWAILYILMGLSAALVFSSDAPGKQTALAVYAAQLLVNFCWSLIFFVAKAYLPAFLWLLLLLVLIVIMIVKFYPISHTAAYLQIPYLLWVLFAGYLNFMIFLLNR